MSAEQIEHISMSDSRLLTDIEIAQALTAGVIDAAREFLDEWPHGLRGNLSGICDCCGFRWPCRQEVLRFALDQYDDLMPRDAQ